VMPDFCGGVLCHATGIPRLKFLTHLSC